MAQVRFYPTDLRRKSASHTLLMAQVPPLKTDLLHSPHPPAPLTLQACTIYPTDLHHSLHPPAPESLLSCQAPAPGTEQRRRTQPSAAATISRNRPLAEHGSGAGERLPSGNRPRARSPTPQVPVIVIPRAKPECISCLSNPADGCSSPRGRGERPPCGAVNTWPAGPQKCNSFEISRLPAWLSRQESAP